MRKITLALSAACLLFSLNSAPSSRALCANAALHRHYRCHSCRTGSYSLGILGPNRKQSDGPLPPMAVGFDIDDTVLFSSPGFWRGKKMYSPDSEAYLKNPAFWEKMNNGWDDYSIPKEVARAVIAMHVKRGDSIYFVTGRSQTKTETVSRTLQDDFQIPAANMNPVIFAGDKEGQNTKTQWLEKKNIKVFYGDSDNDITAAQDTGARAIRVLRASNSVIDRCRWPENLAKR